MENVVIEAETPDWFEYPKEFLRLVDQGILTFEPWFLLRGRQFSERLKGLANRYPHRELVPFARRSDCDDVACWERGRGHQVVIVHDFTTPGFAERKTYSDFWSWFRSAIEDMIEFEP
jgi:hypothetical protein